MKKLTWVALTLAVSLGAFVYHGLGPDRVIADRDTAHFFYPLFRAQRDAYRAGRLPLWNRWQNAGTPMAGNPAASVFYPPKLLVAVLPYAVGLKAFLLGHLVLGFAGVVWLAGRYGLDWRAGLVGAMVYTFSGAVLYQLANVPYLVSAGWLPWVFVALDRLARQTSLRGVIGLSLTWSMCLLGGDPQMTYVTGLLAPVYLLTCVQDVRWTRRVWCALWVPAVAGLVCLLVCAVQVLPTWELARLSTRAARGRPVDWAIYSFHPWRVAELILPSFYGRLWPTNAYWGEMFFPTSGFWTPSAYVGAGTIGLALAGLGHRPGRRPTFFLLMAAMTLWAAFGGFSVLYPAMQKTLPLFSAFRYPSKFLVLTVLGLAVLSAYGLHRLGCGVRWGAAMPVALSVVLLVGAAMLLVQASVLRRWFASRPFASPFYGPFLPDVAFGHLRWSLVQACFVSVAVAVVTLARPKASTALFCWAIVGLVAADLWVANRHLVVSHSRSVWEHTPPALVAIKEDLARRGETGRPFRVYRPLLFEPAWMARTSSTRRMDELFERDVRTLENKNGLLWDVSYSWSDITLPVHHYVRLFRPIRHRGYSFVPRQPFDLFGTRYFVMPADDGFVLRQGCRAVYRSDADGVTVWANPRAFPRAWFVTGVRPVADARLRFAAVYFQPDDLLTPRDRPPVDFRREVLVSGSTGAPATQPAAEPVAARVAFLVDDPEEVALRVEAPCAGFLVLADVDYPGWHADVDGHTAAIIRANHIMRAVAVSKGTHVVRFTYRPWWLGLGGAVTATTVLCLVLAAACAWRRGLRRDHATHGPCATASPASAPDQDAPA